MPYSCLILAIALVSSSLLGENHDQGPQVQVRPPAEVRVDSVDNQTFRVLADGTRVEVNGLLKSGPAAGGTVNLQARPERCDIRFEGSQSPTAVMGRVSLQSRSIPIKVNARRLNGRTDTVSKTILGGNVGVYGLVQEIDFDGTLAITSGEGRLSGDIHQGISATVTIQGNATGSAVARGTTESWVKNSRRSVPQVGYFNINQATFQDTFTLKVNCVDRKLQVSLPLSYPQVDVRAKVNLARTSLRPMFEIGRRFPNASASIRANLLNKYEPTINQKLNNKIKSLVGEKSQEYFQFKKELIQKLLSSEWLNQARKACACT